MLRFPRCRGLHLRRVNLGSVLDRIKVLSRTPTCHSGLASRPASSATGKIAKVENWSIEAVDRQRVAIPVGDRAAGIDDFRVQHYTYGFESLRSGNRNPGCETRSDREVCSIHYTDKDRKSVV